MINSISIKAINDRAKKLAQINATIICKKSTQLLTLMKYSYSEMFKIHLYSNNFFFHFSIL